MRITGRHCVLPTRRTAATSMCRPSRNPRGASDAVDGRVARTRTRSGSAGRLRAHRVGAVTLIVLGAGVSIRLLRRPSGHGGVRSEATTQHVAGAPSVRRERGAARSAHRRIEASARREAGRQRRGAVHQAGRRRGATGNDRHGQRRACRLGSGRCPRPGRRLCPAGRAWPSGRRCPPAAGAL